MGIYWEAMVVRMGILGIYNIYIYGYIMGIYWEAMLVRMGILDIYIYIYIYMDISWGYTGYIYIYTTNGRCSPLTFPGGAAEVSGRSSADPRS